jgi:hypothetical protein
MEITTRSATPKDIWPTGAPHPEHIRDQIMAAAQKITQDEITQSGVTGMARWYIPFYLAEGKVLAQQEQRQEQQKRSITVEKVYTDFQAFEKKYYQDVEVINRNFKDLITPSDKDAGEEDTWFEKFVKALAFEMLLETAAVRDRGDWDVERNYGSGALVEHDGAAWICQKEHTGIVPSHGTVWRRAPGTYFRGIWDEATTYHRGDAVMRSGSCWVAKSETREKPNLESTAWQLMAKCGRDGRDGKDLTNDVPNPRRR